jgi:hypothetical protein
MQIYKHGSIRKGNKRDMKIFEILKKLLKQKLQKYSILF